MTTLENKLRAAFRTTADEIPAEAPPLYLSPQPRAGQHARHTRWPAWAAPLAAAALVIATVAGSLTLAASLKHQSGAAGPSAGPFGVPAYYVALITAKPVSDVGNQLGTASLTDTAAELRSTRTGAVLAKVTPPEPYVSFTGVSAAADDRTFVLSAQGPVRPADPILPVPAQRFFLLHIDPAARAGARMTLTALPARFIPAGHWIHDMALSPDGTHLAAETGTDQLIPEELRVFDLATGTERAWNTSSCATCGLYTGGLLWFGVTPDALSWTADGQHVAFLSYNTFRLLDIRTAGSSLLSDSKTVVTWTELRPSRGAIITPDGRTVLGVEQLQGKNLNGPIREQLVSWSAATGRQTAVLNNLDARELKDAEQILYTNHDGSVLVLTYQQPGAKAALVHDGRSTPIPWSPDIAVAAW